MLYTTLDIQYELSKVNCSLLKPYINNKEPLVYLCSCGGVGSTRLHAFRQGNRCGHCAENTWIAKFTQYGCQVLDYTSAEKVTFVCSCGAIATTRADVWYYGHKQCKKCRTYWNTNTESLNRPKLVVWKKQVLLRDNFTCQSCSRFNELHVHHIEAFFIRPDLAAEVTNGICLCKTCHSTLHRLFGNNVGKENLALFLTKETS